MKKLALIAVVAGFAFASCKKDYTCTCTANGYSSSAAYSKAKKKDAQKACDDSETSLKQAGYSDANCDLK